MGRPFRSTLPKTHIILRCSCGMQSSTAATVRRRSRCSMQNSRVRVCVPIMSSRMGLRFLLHSMIFAVAMIKHATDPQLNPDMAAIDHQNRKEVSRAKTSAPSAGGSTTSFTIRSDIQAKGGAIRGQTGSASSDFDSKAEVVKTPDGTLVSKKSLLKQAGKQVVEDGSATMDNAKDAVKDLLKKK